MEKTKPKIIAILGPTASGKTSLAVRMAAERGGEIVSADSRQVFRGMDIGTGKDLKEYAVKIAGKTIDIPYHMIDVADPMDDYSLADYLVSAKAAVDDIIRRGKLPIICGGTGLYAQALIEGYELTESGPNIKLRERLEAMNALEIFEELKGVDPAVAAALNESDRKNKRRLTRAIEKALSAEHRIRASGLDPEEYDVSIFAISKPMEELEQRIRRRLKERLENEDMVGEVQRLIAGGVSMEKLDSFGLEYRFMSRYLRGESSLPDMEEQLSVAIRQFAKRQMTWLKRWEKQGRRIEWINSQDQVMLEIKKSDSGPT
jgi:tRNA dimethylallyltransferase